MKHSAVLFIRRFCQIQGRKISHNPLKSAFLLGVLHVFSFPFFSVWGLGLIALGGLYLLLIAAPTPKKAFLIGYVYGLSLFAGGLYWICESLFVDIQRFWWLLPFCLFGFPLILSCFTGLSAVLMKLTMPRSKNIWGAVVYGACWTIGEILRSLLFTGFPWNLNGYMWGNVLPIAQLASLFGSIGLGFFTTFFAALVANGYSKTHRSSWVTAALLATLCFGWGCYRLPPAPAFSKTRVRLIQPNIPQAEKWLLNEENTFLNLHLALSFSENTDSLPLYEEDDIIIWSESALGWYPTDIDRDYHARQKIASFLNPGQFCILGAPRISYATDGRPLYWNGLVALNQEGKICASHNKFHLVPFGEYIPLRGLLDQIFPDGFLRKITSGDTDFCPGEGPKTLKIGKHPPFSPLICYEAIFPESVVSRNGQKPKWLLNLTNDGWFGSSTGPYQHLTSAQFRCIEEGLPLVRAANSGISAIIDPYGRIIASLPLNTRGVLRGVIPKPIDSPPRMWRLHEIFCVCVFFLILGCVSRLKKIKTV